MTSPLVCVISLTITFSALTHGLVPSLPALPEEHQVVITIFRAGLVLLLLIIINTAIEIAIPNSIDSIGNPGILNEGGGPLISMVMVLVAVCLLLW